MLKEKLKRMLFALCKRHLFYTQIDFLKGSIAFVYFVFR